MRTIQDSPVHGRAAVSSGSEVHQVHDEVNELRVTDDVTQIARVIALITGGLVLIMGIAALVQTDWGLDLLVPQVTVADMAFTAVTALATTAVGILLLGAASVREGDVRIVLGALLAAFGGAIVLIEEMESSWQLSDRHGWLALLVGGVFLVTGFLTDGRYVMRRTVSHQDRVS